MFDNRSTKINYQRRDTLAFIGCYQRHLPVSITRMMENAYDWEHLPHVHESSFRAIELVNEGDWGWQAITTQPNSRQQHIELLVDKEKCYWATTLLSGDAKGFEIHTQANRVADHAIDISVNFYMPRSFSKVLALLNIAQRVLPFSLYKKVAGSLGVIRVESGDTAQASILKMLQAQYSVLYDEDELLMRGRQEAIDRRKRSRVLDPSKTEAVVAKKALGTEAELKQQLPKLVEFGGHRYVLNRWQDEWVIYGADCPHLLGPLENAIIAPAGIITCPWHGYKFNVLTGQSCSSGKAHLAAPPVLSVVGKQLILQRRP